MSKQQSEQCDLCKLGCWLVDHGVPRSEINRKLTEFLLYLYMWKSDRLSRQKSKPNPKNRESQLLSEFLDLCHFTDPNPLNLGEAQSTGGRTQLHY